LQAVRVAGIRTGPTGEDEGTNCGTCNAPGGWPRSARLGAECLDQLNSTKGGCPGLALFECGSTRDRGTAVISAADLPAYFSHELLTIWTSVMVM
jgi:hypothetical protein